MKISTAQKSGDGTNYDRVFSTANAIVVLDGASSFTKDTHDTGQYVDVLGREIVIAIESNKDLPDLLAEAIDHTAVTLDLEAGSSPSSTVAIVRRNQNTTDLLVLGDTQIVTPRAVLRDTRLDDIGTHHRHRYRKRLKAGHGYDQEHRDILNALQRTEIKYRNKPNGYWIAEATPEAAHHSLNITVENATAPWCVISTDGAYSTLEHLGRDTWNTIQSHDEAQLKALLGACHTWEANHDPSGQALPRAKRHDDKTLAVGV